MIARGPNGQPSGDQEALSDFFNLTPQLSELSNLWTTDSRYKAVHPYFPGAASAGYRACAAERA